MKAENCCFIFVFLIKSGMYYNKYCEIQVSNKLVSNINVYATQDCFYKEGNTPESVKQAITDI